MAITKREPHYGLPTSSMQGGAYIGNELPLDAARARSFIRSVNYQYANRALVIASGTGSVRDGGTYASAVSADEYTDKGVTLFRGFGILWNPLNTIKLKIFAVSNGTSTLRLMAGDREVMTTEKGRYFKTSDVSVNSTSWTLANPPTLPANGFYTITIERPPIRPDRVFFFELVCRGSSSNDLTKVGPWTLYGLHNNQIGA